MDKIEDDIAGGVSMKLYSPLINDFDEYYFRLRPYKNNSRNPWFQEFWQERFKCYIDGDDRDLRYTTKCTGQWAVVKKSISITNYELHYRNITQLLVFTYESKNLSSLSTNF